MKRKFRILVGCERSGEVRRAFRALGHEAFSCDLEPAEDGSPFHIQEDVLTAMRDLWDLGICFPDCTYLCGSGLHWNKRRPGRARKTAEAIRFVEKLWDCGIPHIAIENPTGCLSTRSKLGKPAQRVQPYEFGADASKGTCLFLRNLPVLPIDPAQYIRPRLVCSECGRTYRLAYDLLRCTGCGAECKKLRPRWGNQTDSGQNKLAPSETRAMDRARTYPGIAASMAKTWVQYMKDLYE